MDEAQKYQVEYLWAEIERQMSRHYDQLAAWPRRPTVAPPCARGDRPLKVYPRRTRRIGEPPIGKW